MPIRMRIKLKDPEPAPGQPEQHGQSDQPGPTATLDERTRHLCKLLEKQMLTGKLRLSFGDYVRLIQWRNDKGYDRPHKTIVTWSDPRSEEHTSELQSRQYLVCRLLLEKKKHATIRLQ